MGLQQSKGEKLYTQVIRGNIQGIRDLYDEGADLSWRDTEGRYSLTVACMKPELINVARTLIELGALLELTDHLGNTPLHHAAKRGLDQTVELLLSHKANAFLINRDYHTPLDVARTKGYTNVVRTIERHTSLFSGSLRELHGPLEALAPECLSRKLWWVVVSPCPYGVRCIEKPATSELAIYSSPRDARPSIVVSLPKVTVEEPKFDEPDPVLILSYKKFTDLSGTHVRNGYMFASANEGDKQQLERFHNACKVRVRPQPQVSWCQRSSMARRAVSGTATSASTQPDESHLGSTSSNTASRGNSTDNPRQKGYCGSGGSFPVPSAPPIPESADYGPIHYPSANISSNNVPRESNVDDSSSCKICLDAPVEGACDPCGHMAGCMSCLNEIKAKESGCPICRAKINQILRIYSS